MLLAEGCYQSYEYHRALIFLEEHMAVSKKGLSESREAGLLAVITMTLILRNNSHTYHFHLLSFHDVRFRKFIHN